MDRKEIQDRVKAIKSEIAAIRDSRCSTRSANAHTGIEKTSHEARRAALEAIELELATLSKKTSHCDGWTNMSTFVVKPTCL
jgi:hypothetical protein